MKDFSGIIWVVTFGAAMLFSAFSKARKKQQTGGRNPHEAWPTLFGDEQAELPEPSSENSYESTGAPEHSLSPRMHGQQTQEEPYASTDYYEAQTPDTIGTTPETAGKRTKTANDTERYVKMTASAAPSDTITERMRMPSAKNECAAAHASEETPEAEGPLEEFNLRDAVLYSEILKPKFDE